VLIMTRMMKADWLEHQLGKVQYRENKWQILN